MSSGSLYQPFPPDYSRREYFRKDWTGANDATHHAQENVYTMSLLRISGSSTQRVNPYWPFDQQYWAGGYNPSFNQVSQLANTPNGNTVLSALSKCRTAMRAHDFNASIAFADSEKTLNLLLKSVSNALQFLGSVSRGDLSSALRLIPATVAGKGVTSDRRKTGWSDTHTDVRMKDVSSVWLAVQYGWRPLIKDVMEAIEAFQVRNAGLRVMRFKARARSPKRWIPNTCDDVSTPAPGWLEESVEYSIALKEVPSQARLLGFGLNNWSSVVWERIPFSFVVDWFIPVGQMLEEFAFFQGLNLTYRQTVYQRFTGHVDNCWAYFYPGPQQGWIPGKSVYSAVNVKRTTGAEVGFVLPQLKTFSKSLSATHLKNAAALIYQSIAQVQEGKIPNAINLQKTIGGRPTKWRGSFR